MWNTLGGPTASRLRNLFSLSPPPAHSHQIKPYVFGTKIFLQRYTEINRHLLSKCFKNAAIGRQEMVQCKCFFLTPEAYVLENLQIQKGFWLYCWSILISISIELRFVTLVRFFEENCIVKWEIFFASVFWLGYFSKFWKLK